MEYDCSTLKVVIVKSEMIKMPEPVFRIARKNYTGDTAIVSMRMPKDMLSDIDAVAAETGRTRNEVMMMSMEFALEHLKIENK